MDPLQLSPNTKYGSSKMKNSMKGGEHYTENKRVIIWIRANTFRIFTYMRRRERKTWNFKKYNLSFQYEGKTWEVIHKTTELLYAVELSTKGLCSRSSIKISRGKCGYHKIGSYIYRVNEAGTQLKIKNKGYDKGRRFSNSRA